MFPSLRPYKHSKSARECRGSRNNRRFFRCERVCLARSERAAKRNRFLATAEREIGGRLHRIRVARSRGEIGRLVFSYLELDRTRIPDKGCRFDHSSQQPLNPYKRKRRAPKRIIDLRIDENLRRSVRDIPREINRKAPKRNQQLRSTQGAIRMTEFGRR